MKLPDDDELSSLLNIDFDFTRQPDPISASLRPERRVPLLLLLVEKSHGSGASWKGLQLLNWAVRDFRNVELLLAIKNGKDIPERPIVRFEPALDRAIDLAMGLDLIEDKANRVYRLTTAGKATVRDITATGAFDRERSILKMLQGKVSQREVSRLLEWRDR